MTIKKKMTDREIFDQVLLDAPKYEFITVGKEDVMRGFIRNLWADWCTHALADLSSMDDYEDKNETVQVLMQARNTVISGEWDKASETIKFLRQMAEAMETSVRTGIERMLEQCKLPFDVLTEEESMLPFAPIVPEEEYEED